MYIWPDSVAKAILEPSGLCLCKLTLISREYIFILDYGGMWRTWARVIPYLDLPGERWWMPLPKSESGEAERMVTPPSEPVDA